MKRNITRLIVMVCAVLCASMSVQAQTQGLQKVLEGRGVKTKRASIQPLKSSESKHTVESAKQAVRLVEQKAPMHRALQTRAVEATDVVLLDSVVTETHCEYYEYNEYGWLVSEKHYRYNDTGDGNGSLMFDAESSYLLEYDFDEQGRCTRYARFEYNYDGTKGKETERVIATWAGAREHTEQYFALPYDEEWDKLEPTAEISYDKYGNYCLLRFYDWDSDKKAMVLEEHWEMKFTGGVMEYYYDDKGNLEGMDFGDNFDRHCYYYLDYNLVGDVDGELWYRLYAYKVDRAVEGLTTTKTRYEVSLDESEGDKIDLAQLDSYWAFIEEEVVMLTPSRNRYASLYYYEVEEEEMEGDDVMPGTRAAGGKVLDISYVFEWDALGRLVKYVESEGDGDDLTYTCTYHGDKYNELTLEQFETLLYGGEGAAFAGYTYGQVHKERHERYYAYAEDISDEYDADGNLLHYTTTEVYYSDEEVGEDWGEDGEMSTEREVYNYETWLTYDADGNMTTRIICDLSDGIYTKYEYINERGGELYLTGNRMSRATSKEGPWTFGFENVDIYDVDPSTDPYASAIGGWTRSYNSSTQTWEGSKWEYADGYHTEYPIDPQTGEFITPGGGEDSGTQPDQELQQGWNSINFTEGGWRYSGEAYAEYVWDEVSGTDVLKINSGWMEIHWVGGRAYCPMNPADNYSFPVGAFAMGMEDESVGVENMESLHVKWMDGWRVMYGGKTVAATTHYTNEQGQVVNEHKTYTLDAESGRMVALPDVNLTIYSFDVQARLVTIETSGYTIYYIYRNDECDYLLESYTVDKATGAKYDVCKYYYSDGKYTSPYAGIEEVEAVGAYSICGRTIAADGDIRLYDLVGKAVVHGNGSVVAPQGGLYIVEVNGTRAKILVK